MTDTPDTEYSAALALDVAFAVQELVDARKAHEAEPTKRTEAKEYLATLKLANPDKIAALLKRIDTLEAQLAGKRREVAG